MRGIGRVYWVPCRNDELAKSHRLDLQEIRPNLGSSDRRYGISSAGETEILVLNTNAM